MTTTDRDTRLRYLVSVSGDPALAKLAEEIIALGSASAGSEKQVDALLDELSNAQRGKAAVEQYASFTRQLDETREKLVAARAGAAELFKTFDEGDSSNRRVTKSFADARAAIANLEETERKQQLTLQRLRGDLAAVGVDYRRLGSAQGELNARTTQATAALRELGAAVRTAATDQQRLADAQRNAEETQLRGVRASAQATLALQRLRQNAAGTAKEVRNVGDASGVAAGMLSRLRAVAAGIAGYFSFREIGRGAAEILKVGAAAEETRDRLGDLFGGQEAGMRVFADLEALALRTGQSFEVVQSAAIKLKQQGIDPLDGTLQSLIDLGAKLNLSQADLERTITTLGKAYTRNALSLRDIVSLTNQGIPVFDLLAKATGKTEGELRKLAKQGGLTRDTIKLLFDQIGESAAGGAAEDMAQFGSLIDQIKERVRQFFRQVADSGALEFFRKQMQSFIATVDSLARSGQLAQFAKRVSDAIVSMSEALISVGSAIKNHASQIATLAATYAGFKLAGFVGQLFRAAGGLSDVAKKMDEAAKKAAEGKGAIGQLGAKFLTFRANVLLATAALVGFAAVQLHGAIQGISEDLARGSQAQRDLDESTRRTQSALRDQVDALREVQQVHVANRDIAALSASELRDLTAEDLASYRQRVESAQTYAKAQLGVLSIQQELFGSTIDLGEETRVATERYHALTAAMQTIAGEQERAARAAAGGVTAGVQAAIDEIERLIGGAKDSANSLSGLFNGVDFGDVDRVAEIATALAKVAETGEQTKETLRSGLVAELAKLNGTDLSRFQFAVQQAMGEAGGSSKELSDVLDVTLQDSLRRLGVSANVAGVEITDAGRQMIATFEAIATNAQASSLQVRAAFMQALDSAATRAEVERLKQGLQLAFEAGTISAAELGTAMDAASFRVEQLRVAAIDAAGGFDELGARAAAAAATVESTAKRAAAVLEQQRNNAAAMNAEIQQMAKKTAAAGDATAQAAQQAGGAAAGFRGVIESLLAEFNAESKVAGQYFKDQISYRTLLIANTRMFRREINAAAEGTRALIAEQQALFEGQMRAMDEFAATGVDAQGRLGTATRFTSQQLLEQAAAIRAGQSSLNALNQTKLDALAASIERAAGKAQELEDRARGAKQALEEMSKALKDQRDAEDGNEEAIEQRRFDEELARIRALREEGGREAAAAAAEAEQLARDQHKRNLARIREEANERRRQSQDEVGSGGGGGNSSSSLAGGSSGSSSSSTRGGGSVAAPQDRAPVVNNTTLNVGVLVADDKSLEQLERQLRPARDRIDARTSLLRPSR